MQYKILFGYVLLMIIIGCMAALLFRERNRIQTIESEANVILLVRHEINNIHCHITNSPRPMSRLWHGKKLTTNSTTRTG